MGISETNFTTFLLLVPLVFIGYFLLSVLYEAWINYRLKTRGVVIEGTITDVIRDSWRGTRHCFVTYEYDTAPMQQGGLHTARQNISEAHYERLAEGQMVLIRYLPDAPQTTRLAADDIDFTVRDAALRRVLILVVVWIALLVITRL